MSEGVRDIRPVGRQYAGSPWRDGVQAREESGMNYRVAYAMGFHPWEELAEHPPYRDKLLALVAREEEGREASYGRALDIGTGSGVWGVQLAKRGWAVTGIDAVEKAIARARTRSEREG